MSLVDVIGPNIEPAVAKILLDRLASFGGSRSLVVPEDGVLTICDLLRMDYVLQNVVAPLRLQEWQEGMKRHLDDMHGFDSGSIERQEGKRARTSTTERHDSASRSS